MKISIAITLGDPAGIGPEITAKTLADPETYRLCNPVVVGESHVMRMGIEVAGTNQKINIIEKLEQAEYRFGTIDLVDLNNIDPAKIKKLVGEAPGLFNKVRSELSAFADFLEQTE